MTFGGLTLQVFLKGVLMARTKGIFKRGRIYWITYMGLDGQQKWESTKSSLKADADYLLACRKKEVAEGTAPVVQKRNRNFTFNDLAEKYKTFCQNQKGHQKKESLLNKLVQEFGAVKLINFNLAMIEGYQARRLSEARPPLKGKETPRPPARPATVNRSLEVLKHAFTKAYDWEMIPEEVLKRLRKVKKTAENNRRLRYLSIEESRNLVDAAENHLKPILITALNTGMRRGEILNLQWDQVDLKHGFILLTEEMTKTERRREIPINTVLREVLQKQIRRLDVPHVFYDPETGKPYQDVKRSFGTACRRVGIRDFRFHDLRHTFASQLVMNGVDITAVSKLLGHTTLTMTLRYAHLAPDHLKNAVDVLSRLQSSLVHDGLHDTKSEKG